MYQLRLSFGATALAAVALLAYPQPLRAQDDSSAEAPAVDPDALFEEALTRYQRGGVTRAYSEFKQVVALVPTHTNALYNVASIAATQDRATDCVLYTHSYLAQVPDDPDAETLRAQLTACTAMLEETGTLTIELGDPDTMLLLNGLVMRPEATVPIELPAGDYTISATLRDHDPYTTTVTVAADSEQTVPVQLTAITYYGHVVIVYPEAGADVTVDGQSVGTTPLAEPLRLAEGRYLFGVTRPGFHPWSRYVDVTRDEEAVQEVRLLDESIDLDTL
ncbi:MAG: PEGA domain-containing protein [Myxococcales bacterium]|nr:PEGA domain-containing protein [Myxococcales bacterium]